MTVQRGFLIAISSAVACTVLGGLFGIVLAFVAPNYYRIVLRVPANTGLSTLVEAGFGLGVTQGLAAGIVIGLVIVAAVTWYESCRATSRPE